MMLDWRNRTYCGDIAIARAGDEVLLMGWVDAVRDHGNLLFIHLRDIRGIVQVVFDPAVDGNTYDRAAALKVEDVVEIVGRVAVRKEGTKNPNLDTGDVEVAALRLKVLSPSTMLPFQISEKAMVFGEEIETSPEHVDEELRLQYRYLDLRRPSVQQLMIKRYQIIKCIRDFFHEHGFIEVETPFLTKSTPEGARDYLVPSRVHKGAFYALPQSPQLFKQLLMVGGMDRYFQLARCFRDEDLRPNRQPEFTQLDMEASFIDEEFIYETIEELTVRMFALGGITLARPFPRMTYRSAMNLYGTDRPDLRFAMAFDDVTDILKDTDYTVFRHIISKGGMVKGFCVKGKAASLSKNVLQNEYAMRVVPSLGARGMTWMKVVGDSLESNIVQFFSSKERNELIARFGARDGDVLMMIADSSPHLVNKVLGELRLHVAHRLHLIPQNSYSPLWVTDFPAFEFKDGSVGSQHHPFTMPDREDFDPADRDELMRLNSRAYDLVMNGEELGGGSIRIHRMDVQEKIFRALGLSRNDIENKFGFFLRALRYGAPPHGGLALGIDRVVAMILGAPSIREVIAFPKNRSAFCPLTRAPSEVKEAQLKELGLGAHGAREKKAVQVPGRPREQDAVPGDGRGERISREEVTHVARLARLSLPDDEITAHKEDLNAILEYVETLKELNTDEVRPLSNVMSPKNVWREDEPQDTRYADGILSGGPDQKERYFRVPKILEG